MRTAAASVTLLFALFALAPLRGADDELWGPNLLRNGSFEEGEGLPAGWRTGVGARIAGSGSASIVALDDDVRADGKQSLRIDVKDANTTFHALTSEPVKVTAGARYLLSARMRVDRVKAVGKQYTNCNLFVSFRDARGRAIRIGGYPVVGTEALLGTRDWQPVERLLRAPAGAATAVVGCFLSCSGTAWFDAVSFRAQAAIPWKRQESARFRYFFEARETLSPAVMRGNDRNLERLEKLLGITHPEKIDYYKYASGARKGAITGNEGNAHVEGSEIHTIFWSDRHEVVHVLANHGLGENTIALLGEGLAVHLSGAWHGRPVHVAARRLRTRERLLPLEDLIETADFRSKPDDVTYPQSGSLVGFLIERHGIERFKRLYVLPEGKPAATTFPDRLREVYGTTVAELEKEWLRFLGR